MRCLRVIRKQYLHLNVNLTPHPPLSRSPFSRRRRLYKKYLYLLTHKASKYGFEKVRQSNFKKGIPIAYVEDGYLVYEFKNGAKQYMNSKMQVVKVTRHGRKSEL